MNTWLVIYLFLFIVFSVWIDFSFFVPKKEFTVLAEDPSTPLIVKNAVEQRIVLEEIIGFQKPEDKEKKEKVPSSKINENKEPQLCNISSSV